MEDTKMKTNNQAERQAWAKLYNIVDMVKALKNRDPFARDLAEIRIQESILSLQIRDGWHTQEQEGEPAEFELLLCTGGPAVRIIGSLGRHNAPENPRLEY